MQTKNIGHLALVKNSTFHERDNQHNRFAVAVLEKGTDHEIGRKCLKMDGIIDVEVTGKCQGSGLPKEWPAVS